MEPYTSVLPDQADFSGLRHLINASLYRMTSSYQEITARLKKRFHGIDSIIDKCVETVLVWKRDPHLFERPLVVNLWGATGTGKTSMVIEILRELGLFGRTLYLNFSDTDSVNDSLDIEEHIRDL